MTALARVESGAGSRPKLSFGLVLRDGGPAPRAVIESVLAQSCADLELIVCAEGSSERGAAHAAESAARDGRVRLVTCAAGEGMNGVLRHARGEYFRWLDPSDSLEPAYAAACAAALDRRPDAIGVTCSVAYCGHDGHRERFEYHGARVDSHSSAARFARCLRLLHEDSRYFAPLRATYRRAVLAHTRGLPPIVGGEAVLAAELSLRGPYVHLPECLATHASSGASRAVSPRAAGEAEATADPERLLRNLLEVLERAALTPRQRLACRGAALRYYLRELERVRLPALGAALRRELRRLGVPIAQGLGGATRQRAGTDV